MKQESRPDGPPDFAEARNKRQRVRAAGLDPNYWYAVEFDRAVNRGQVVQVRFWHRSVALFRTAEGRLSAVEDRCAHRQLALSLGAVTGDRLVCSYHGWSYDREGRLVEVPHELFGRRLPNCSLKTFPVRVRYGLVWIFFGDRERADEVPLPEIPELEGQNGWECVPLDFTWRGHHSMIIDNVSDFTHAYLHRRYRPFSEAVLKNVETRDDKVFVSYDAKIGQGRVTGLFVDRGRINTNVMDLCYEYPYQWSNTDGKIKHWCFVLPMAANLTRVFFLFYFEFFKVPFLPIDVPRFLMRPLLSISNRFHIAPLLRQDGWAIEAEQRGYEQHFDAPIVELNPAVHAFQDLTIRKWEEHLAREKLRGAPHAEKPDAERLASSA